jgi:hypothetical protein
MALRLFTSPGTEKKDQSDFLKVRNDNDDNDTGAYIFLIMREI